MTRRRLVALVAATVLALIGTVLVSAVLFFTRTSAGRERLRRVAEPVIAGLIHGGKVYIGTLRGISPTEITIDSLAIRDRSGELFLSTGRLTVDFDPRD